MGILGFLSERETGSFKAQRYRQCHKSVREWLERLSASPVLNQPCEFSGEPKATFLVDFSPDRTKIASAHGDHTVRVTEISTGKCTHILTGHPRTPWCLAFHPSHDDILASGCLGGQVRIWDLRGGGSEVFHSDSNSLIASLTFHPIDRVLVFSTKNMLYFWNWTQQEPFTSCTTTYEYERVRWVKFDRLGHYLYTGICNNTTVTRPPMYDIVNRNDRQSGGVSHPNWQQRQSNRQRYERLVSQIRDDQQQRLRDSTTSERPRSPVHEDRLRQAYDYARYVTSHSRDNYNWIQLSRRRAARRGGTVDVDESANRPAARYSMFSLGSHVLQPGANSPPPRPLPESDRSESDHGTDSTHSADQHRNVGTDQQDDEPENADTDSQAVGSGRTGNPRITLLNRLIGLEARSRVSRSLAATSTTVAAGQGSSQASASSSSASEGDRTQTTVSQEASNNSERMDVDDSADSDRDAQTSVANPGDALAGERSVRSANQLTFPQRLGLLFGDGGPESRANPPPSTHISTGASSVPPSASAGRTLGQGEGSGAWGEIAARTEASRSVGTGASTTQRGTLYSALSRLSSISNSAFSVPSSRSGSASSSLQSVGSNTSSLGQGRDGCVSVSAPSSGVTSVSGSVDQLSSRTDRPASGVTSVSGSVDQLSSRTDRPASGTENFAWLTTAVSSSASTGSSSQGTAGRSALSTSTDTPHLSTSLSSSSVEANSSGASSANNTVSSALAAKRSYSAAFTPSSLPLETTQTPATINLTALSLLRLRNRDSTRGQAGSSSIQVQSSSSSSSQESASGASISWRSRLLPWEQGSSSSSSSSLARRILVSTDFLEGGEYTPGSMSCQYLHTQLTATPMEQPDLRASIITDINRVRRLANNALSWSCDFDVNAPGNSRFATGPPSSRGCPVCRNPQTFAILNPTGVDRILPLPSAPDFPPPRRQRLPGQRLPGQRLPGQRLSSQQYLPGQELPPQQWLPGQQRVPGQRLPGQQLSSQQYLPGQELPPQQWLPGQQRVPGQRLPGQQLSSQQYLPGQELPPQQWLPGQQRVPGQRVPGQSCLRIPSLGRELTSDGTSQTQGQLNEPEHADRGTDMAGLGQQEGGGYVGDLTAARKGGAQHGSEPGERRLQRVESDLERQLSENDDEISRIEHSYLEEMERLASERQRILSTLIGRREPREPGSSLSSCQTDTPSQTTDVTSLSTSDSSHAALGAGSGSSRLGVPPSLSDVSQTDTSASVETGSGTQTSGASVCSADEGVAMTDSVHPPDSTSPHRTALCAGGISTASSLQHTVSLSTVVIETSHNSPATSRSDSVSVTVSDSSHNLHAMSRSDPVAVSVSDSSNNSHAMTRSDPVAVSFSDSSNNSHAMTRSDPVAVSFSDSSNNSHAMTRSDPVAVSFSDSSNNSHAMSRSDPVAVTVSDSSNNSHAMSRPDPVAVTVSDSSHSSHGTSRFDPVAVSFSDSSNNSHAMSRSDPVAVSVSDSSHNSHAMSRSDPVAVSVSDSSNNSHAMSRSDPVAVTVSDSSNNSHAMTRSDPVAVSFSDSSNNSHAMSRSDPVAVTVSDSSNNSHAMTRSDPVAVSFSDSSNNSHAMTRSDPVAVSFSDSSNNSHAMTRSDPVAVSFSDSSNNSHAMSRPDSVTVSVSDSSNNSHAMSRSDPVAVTVSDSSNNSHAMSRSDPVAVSVSDSSQGVSSSDGSATLSRQETDIGPFHTLPTATGSDSDRIEVLTGSGESEMISFSELARRLANRDDVMVVGNHRMAPASNPDVTVTTAMLTPSAVTPATVSSGEQRSGHLLRSCLVGSSTIASRPAPVPPPLPRPPLSTPISSSATAGRPVPPVILVQQPALEDQPSASGQSNAGSSRTRGSGDADWYGLEQRHLHPHYSRSILDDTINRPTDAMQSAINRAIAGVFMSSGEQAVASNIVPGTHRVQRWDFTQCHMPDLRHKKANIVVEHCKIHNDASIDISSDSSLLATFVNNHGGFPDDNILAVFSLRSESFGQCLYTKSFGPNAISVSLSPSNQYVMVGLASKRMMWIQVTDQLVGQTFKLNKAGAGEYSMMHVTDLYHPVRRPTPLVRGMSPVSVNSARWLPDVGEGIVYGTNHGDLHFYRAGRTKAGVEEEEAKPRKLTISTQTGTGSIRRSAFTQTIEDDQ